VAVGNATTPARIECGLLSALCENPRLTLSPQQLLDRVWGESWVGDQHVVDVYTTRELRHIRTVGGLGYRPRDGA